MPESVPLAPPIQAPPIKEPEIYTIPEKFYGTALKAPAPQVIKEQVPGALAQPATHPAFVPMILGGVALLVVGVGAFVYIQRDVLFPPPTPPAVVVETPKVDPPLAPTAVVATSTNPQSASVTWMDNASNESGYRIERSEESGPFQGITSLSANSASFQDASVSPGKQYRYRIIALNQAGETPSSEEAMTNVPSLPPPLPEAPKLPPAGLDTDSDGLTDLEEVLFSTDPRTPDTDTDGFLDGNEVFHLYNPGGRAPGKLIEAGLVKEERGASMQWAMSIPTSWTITHTDAEGFHAMIDTGRPETFLLSIEDNPNNLSLVDWYKEKYPSIQESQLLHFRSKKGYEGIIGADLLTTYIPWGNRIFVLTYDLKGQPFINYRTTYSMMLNSLMLSGVPQISPPVAGAPLPFEPAATTTGVVSQPEALTP